jgi:hypothetical protein
MYKIIGLPLLCAGIYYFRYKIGEFLVRKITTIQIEYNKWYIIKYPKPNYRIFKNENNEILDENTVSNYGTNNDVYNIEYQYKNRTYSIHGKDLNNILYYVRNIDTIINPTNRKYNWIMANDENDNNCLDKIKMISGPLGDFYRHYNIDIYSDDIKSIRGKRIKLIDHILDEYTIEPSTIIKL